MRLHLLRADANLLAFPFPHMLFDRFPFFFLAAAPGCPARLASGALRRDPPWAGGAPHTAPPPRQRRGGKYKRERTRGDEQSNDTQSRLVRSTRGQNTHTRCVQRVDHYFYEAMHRTRRLAAFGGAATVHEYAAWHAWKWARAKELRTQGERMLIAPRTRARCNSNRKRGGVRHHSMVDRSFCFLCCCLPALLLLHIRKQLVVVVFSFSFPRRLKKKKNTMHSVFVRKKTGGCRLTTSAASFEFRTTEKGEE